MPRGFVHSSGGKMSFQSSSTIVWFGVPSVRRNLPPSPPSFSSISQLDWVHLNRFVPLRCQGELVPGPDLVQFFRLGPVSVGLFRGMCLTWSMLDPGVRHFQAGFGLVLQTGPWVSLVCSGDMAGLVHSLRIGPCLSALPRV